MKQKIDTLKQMLFGLASLCILLSGCNSDLPDNPVIPPVTPPEETEKWQEEKAYYQINLNADEQRILTKANSFALDFFKGTRSTNLVMSPFSLFSSLAMLANGDDDKTKEEILTYLGVEESDSQHLNSFIRTLNNGLEHKNGKSRFVINNSIWVKDESDILPSFADLMDDCFNTETCTLSGDYNNDSSAINEWVTKKTDSMITEYLGYVSSDFSLVTTQYFAGGWTADFNNEEIRDSIFVNNNGSESIAQYLYSHAVVVNYNENDRFISVGFNIGHGNYRMSFITNVDGTDFNRSVEEMDLNELNDLLKENEYTIVKAIRMPKFSVNSLFDNIMLLKHIGGKDKGFRWTFNKILSNKSLHLNTYPHSVKLEIDDHGINGVKSMSYRFTKNLKVPEIVFDRPFIYVVEEVSTGAILIMGAVDKL